MTVLELKDKRENLNTEAENILNAAKSEKRKLTDDENKRFDELTVEINQIGAEIKLEETRELEEATNTKNIKIKIEKNNMETFNLLQAIRSVVERKPLSNEISNVIEGARTQLRAAGVDDPSGNLVIPFESMFEKRTDPIVVGTQYQGQEVVAESKLPLLVGLKSKTVLGAAGVTFLTGLKNNLSIPTYDGTTCYWADEVDSTTGGTGAFAEITLAPKRLTAEVNISRTFIAQDSIGANEAIKNEIMNAIYVKLENTFFDANAATTKRPAGLFYGANYAGTLSGATSWAKLVGMRTAIDSSNALTGNLAYITTPELGGVFETTAKESGAAIFCMENGKVGGYNVLTTSNVPSGKVAFANWADAIVANWGDAMDITIDTISRAKYNQVSIIVNTYWDFAVKRSASFKLNQMS